MAAKLPVRLPVIPLPGNNAGYVVSHTCLCHQAV